MVGPTVSAATAAEKGGRDGQGDSYDQALTFDTAAYTTISVTIDGTLTPIRWYKEVCYVAKPILMATQQVNLQGKQLTLANPHCGYQSMNIYVPESAFNNQDTAIYFAVGNGGWFATDVRQQVTDGASYNSATSNMAAALKAGYLAIDVGNRSRGVVAADGTYAGKAPAAAVDAKAAVRYLRLNDARMPGSAERIVVNGTSGGGAMSSILGASGNSKDFYPYLDAIGAAGINRNGESTIRDDVFAINAYCPITDLGDADIAYEWMYSVLDTRAKVGTNPNPAATAELAAKFADYERSLRLRNPDGSRLTADNMLDTIRAEVIRSAETYMAADPANVIPDLGETFTVTSGNPPQTDTYTNTWIDVDNDANKVVSLDMDKYLQFVATQATLKPVPAFDHVGPNGPLDVPATRLPGESNLFGTPSQGYSNFTEYGWDHNTIPGDGVGLDDTGLTWARFIRRGDTVVDEQVNLINPMRYIGTSADTAPYWYVRHGTRDRDTSFTISVNLDRALEQDRSVRNANYRLAWNQPHAGNYDVPEAMQWIADSLAKADTRLATVTLDSGQDAQTIQVQGDTVTAIVPAGTERVTLNAEAAAQGATVRAPDSVRVSSRPTATERIVVKSADGGYSRAYTLKIVVATH